MSSIQNNNLQLFAETVLKHAKIGNTFHINTLLKENYYRIPEDLKNKLLQIITSFAKDSIRTTDRGLLVSRVQEAFTPSSAQVEMQAHNTHKNPRLEASKTTLFNLPSDLKWTIYSYLNPRELTTLGYVSRSVQKTIFQDILAVLDRNLRSSISYVPHYAKALHLSTISDVFDISLIKHDKLNAINLSNSNITDTQLAQIIDRCPNLTHILLNDCPLITDAAAKKLAAKCPLLTLIDLSCCPLITDAAVKELAAKYPLLTIIGLANCPLITDAAVKELAAKCPLLTTIALRNCRRITDAAVIELAAKCPLLTIIGIGYCSLITDAAVIELAAKCPLLTVMWLDNCRLITDAAVMELAAKCPLLTSIDFRHCPRITDAAVKELAAKCPLLAVIGLNNCTLVTDAAVKELAAKCRLLTEIYLSGTPITTISCIFLAKYSSKLKQIVAAPELQSMFQQYKQAFSYVSLTELGEKYRNVLNYLVNCSDKKSNSELLNYICDFTSKANFQILQHVESEILKKAESLCESDKNKLFLFLHQLAGKPPVPNPLQWGMENYKANYARAADALHMLESSTMAGHDKPESKKE